MTTTLTFPNPPSTVAPPVPDFPGTIQPALLLGYESTRESTNKIHAVLGRSDPEVTLGAAGLRTGSLLFLCVEQTQALDVEAMHSAPGVITLSDDERPSVGMSYVTDGRISVALDDETRDYWTVSIDFQEVAPT